MMLRTLVEHAHKWLNLFPAKNGVSKALSPFTIMTGKPCPDYNDLKIDFGAYALVYEDNNPTNTMRTRCTGAIALNATGNNQGGYYFMSLVTGRRLSRQQWDELPMPNGVIKTVEGMAEEENQPLVRDGHTHFEWAPGVPIDDNTGAPIPVNDEPANQDDNEPGELHGPEDQDSENSDDSDNDQGAQPIANDKTDTDADGANDTDSLPESDGDLYEEESDEASESAFMEPDDENFGFQEEQQDQDSVTVDETEELPFVEEEEEEHQPGVANRYNLRSKKVQATHVQLRIFTVAITPNFVD
jgi:hypothetical protein